MEDKQRAFLAIISASVPIFVISWFLRRQRREPPVIKKNISSNKKTVIISGGHPKQASKYEIFKEKFNIIECEEKEVHKYLHEADAILAMGHIGANQKLFDSAPKLKIIARRGAGYDGVDATYAAEKGIWITNTPNVIAKATADIAIMHLLDVSRRFSESQRWLRNGNFKGGSETFLANDPEGKILGILGMGGIGKQIAKRASAFDMRIIYHNRNRLPESEEQKYGNAIYVTKAELLARSDFITVNVPSNADTKYILDRNDFKQMKDGVFIINTSRGITINEQALVEALKSGKVKGAGLDVFENEPDIHPKLKKFPNVSLTPHIGTATFETRRDMEDLALENIEAVLDGHNPPTPVSECNSLII